MWKLTEGKEKKWLQVMTRVVVHSVEMTAAKDELLQICVAFEGGFLCSIRE